MFNTKLKALIALGILLSGVFINSSSFAKTDPLLEDGINAFQKGDWDVARDKFLKLYNLSPWKFAALYNLGNTALRQNHFGEALAFYKRALALNPHDNDLNLNIKFVTESSGVLPVTTNKSNFELIRNEILNRFTFDEFLGAFFVCSIFFFAGLYKFLKLTKLIGGRPPINAFLPLTAILFLGFFVLAILKLIDSYSARGTIIVAKEELRSGPHNQNASLFELSEGLEVKIVDNTSGWRQVTYPGGITGWIPESSIMPTSGWGPW